MTLLEVAVKNAGLHLALTGLVWALKWAATRDSLGRDPSAEEVASWWKRSVRTTYREKAAFKAAFPTLESPAKIFEDPIAQAKISNLAIGGGELKIQERPRREISDLKILELGLVEANL